MLDQDVVNLAKAIREHETGNRQVQGSSGEMASRYQYLPGTWKSTAGKYLGNQNAELTLENENKATYLKIKDWKDQGYNVGQIASMWNSGSPEWKGKVGTNDFGVNYDVPKYVDNVYAKYKGIKAQTQPLQVTESGALGEVKQEEEKPGFLARVKEDISKRAEGLGEKSDLQAEGKISKYKQIMNFASHGLGMVGDVLGEGLISLARTETAKEIGGDIKEKYSKWAENNPESAQSVKEIGGAALELVKKGGEEYEELKKTNPALATDLSTLGNIAEFIPYERAFKYTGKGIQKSLSKLDEFVEVGKRTIGDVADKVETNKITAGVIGKAKELTTKAADLGEKATKYGLTQATGLESKTITKIIANPEKYTDDILKAVDKESFAKNVFGKIDDRIKALGEAGKGYDVIRNSGAKATIRSDFFDDILKKELGFDIVDGKIVAGTKSATRNTSDINAIQRILDDWGDKLDIDADEFLNLRKDLADLSYRPLGSPKTGAASEMGNTLRTNLNKEVRDEIPGLKELDDVYSSEKKILEDVRKDYFKKDGALKDNAIAKLSNIGNKEPVIKRLEEIVPDIREQLNVLEVVKDIEYASGRAVGTYTRSIVAGGGIATGNVPAMVGAIVSSPKIAVPLLRKYGAAKLIAKPLIESTVLALKQGKKLVDKQIELFKAFLRTQADLVNKWIKDIKGNQAGFQKLPFGKSLVKRIEDITPDEVKILEDFIDNTRLKKKILPDDEMIARQLAEEFDLNPGLSKAKLANEFENILETYGNVERPLKKGLGETPKTTKKGLGETKPIQQEITKAKAEGKSFEEFVGNKEKLFRGGEIKELGGFEDRGTYLTPDKGMANIFAGKKGEVYELYVDKKQLNIKKSKGKIGEAIEDQMNNFTDDLVERPQDFSAEISKFRRQGINAVESLDGRQLLIFDKSQIKTKSELKNIWNSTK